MACVKKHASKKIDLVILNSKGGNVQSALQIGDILATYRAHMIVKRRCNSSCANYFLPVARKVTVSAKSLILLHGSIDGGFVKMAVAQNGPERFEGAQALADAQSDYAERHDIHRGWLLYRNSYGKTMKQYMTYLDGALGWTPEINTLEMKHPLKLQGFLIEQTMLESCLKNVVIEDYQDTALDRAKEKISKRMNYLKQGFVSSGTLQCSSNKS